MKIDIQHESWIFISMDVFLGFNIQRYSTTYVLKLWWYVPIFSSSWILLYCMHLKLKPLSIDVHATTRSNKTSKLQATYLGHVPLMTWILNHDCKSRLQNTFSHPCYKTLAFLQKCEHFYDLHKIVPLQINLTCKKVMMHITIDCEIQAIAFTTKQITH